MKRLIVFCLLIFAGSVFGQGAGPQPILRDSMGIDTDGNGTIDAYLYSTVDGAFHLKKGSNITLTVTGDTVTIAGDAGSGTADSMGVDTDGNGTVDSYLYSTVAGAFHLKEGTGMVLTVAGDTVTVATTLGTAIVTGEITDGTILEADLNVTNAPTGLDNYLLSLNEASNNFTWVASGGGEANTASDAGSGFQITHPKAGVDLPFKTFTGGNAITLDTGTANQLNFAFDGGASPAGELGGTWASPTIDDLFVRIAGDSVGGTTGTHDFNRIAVDTISGVLTAVTTLRMSAQDLTDLVGAGLQNNGGALQADTLAASEVKAALDLRLVSDRDDTTSGGLKINGRVAIGYTPNEIHATQDLWITDSADHAYITVESKSWPKYPIFGWKDSTGLYMTLRMIDSILYLRSNNNTTIMSWNDTTRNVDIPNGNLTISGTVDGVDVAALNTGISTDSASYVQNDEMDASSELLAIMDDETGSAAGTPLLVFNYGPTFNHKVTVDSLTADSIEAEQILATAQMRAECDLHTEGNLHINKDSTDADAAIYFGDNDEVTSIHWDDVNDRFETSNTFYVGGNVALLGTVDGVDVAALNTGVATDSSANRLAKDTVAAWDNGALDSTNMVADGISVSGDLHACTSAELAGVLSDETGGTAKVVFNASPDFTGTITADSGTFNGNVDIDSIDVVGAADFTGTVTVGTLAGTIDAGGATSFEIPNGTAPAITVEGQVGWDTDDNAFEVTDGTNDMLMGPIKTLNVLIWNPDLITDTVSIYEIDSAEAQGGIKIVNVSLQTSVDGTYAFNLYSFTAADPPVFHDHIDTLNVGATDQRVASNTFEDANASSVDVGQHIYINTPATDIDWIRLKVRYYIKAND